MNQPPLHQSVLFITNFGKTEGGTWFSANPIFVHKWLLYEWLERIFPARQMLACFYSFAFPVEYGLVFLKKLFRMIAPLARHLLIMAHCSLVCTCSPEEWLPSLLFHFSLFNSIACDFCRTQAWHITALHLDRLYPCPTDALIEVRFDRVEPSVW